MLVVLLCFEADNLQDAGVGDVRHYIRDTLPHSQQSSTQHVILTEAHALQTLLAFFNLLTLPIPTETAEKTNSFSVTFINHSFTIILWHETKCSPIRDRRPPHVTLYLAAWAHVEVISS